MTNPIIPKYDTDLSAANLAIVRMVREKMPQDLFFSTGHTPPKRYTGPIVWKIPEGIHFGAIHQYGPCFFPRENSLLITNDEPSTSATVLFVPRFVPGCRGRRFKRQIDTIQSFGDKAGLPKNFFTSAGPAGIIGALMLKVFELTGEQVPKDYYWALTDSQFPDGKHLLLSIMSTRHGLSYEIETESSDVYDYVGSFPFAILDEG